LKGLEVMNQLSLRLRQNENLCGTYFRMEFEWPIELSPPVPGQFLTLRTGRGFVPLLRRPFAFSGFHPERRQAEIIYEKRGDGTTLLSELSAGTTLDVLAPLGNTFPFPKEGRRPLLLAGGIGMGPMFFFAEQLAQRGLNPLLVLGSRNSLQIPILPLFRMVETLIATNDGSRGFSGTALDCLSSYLEASPPEELYELYACGPYGMMKAGSSWAKDRNIQSWVSMEQTMGCAVGACMGCVIRVFAPQVDEGIDDPGSYARVCTEGPVFSGDLVDWEGAIHG